MTAPYQHNKCWYGLILNYNCTFDGGSAEILGIILRNDVLTLLSDVRLQPPYSPLPPMTTTIMHPYKIIGASLSKPHTSRTALRKCVCMLACLLACLLAYLLVWCSQTDVVYISQPIVGWGKKGYHRSAMLLVRLPSPQYYELKVSTI